VSNEAFKVEHTGGKSRYSKGKSPPRMGKKRRVPRERRRRCFTIEGNRATNAKALTVQRARSEGFVRGGLMEKALEKPTGRGVLCLKYQKLRGSLSQRSRDKGEMGEESGGQIRPDRGFRHGSGKKIGMEGYMR